jgi:hypothetical protein
MFLCDSALVGKFSKNIFKLNILFKKNRTFKLSYGKIVQRSLQPLYAQQNN